MPKPDAMRALHTADDGTDSDDSDRSRPSRRAVLGAVGTGVAAAVAGCTAGAAPDPDATDGALLDTTAEVDPDRYGSFRFELPGERWVTVEAALSDRSLDVKQDGPAVDVVVMTAGQFARFRDGGPFDYRPAVSMPDVVTGGVSGTLPAGEYVLVVDNSDAGPSRPGSDAVRAVVACTVAATPDRDRLRAGGRPGGR
jgi:hypothetical protein